MKSQVGKTKTRENGRPPSVFSVGEFARTLGVGEMSVYRAIHGGRLPAIKFGNRYLVPVRALDDLLDAAMSSGGLVDVGDWVKAAEWTEAEG